VLQQQEMPRGMSGSAQHDLIWPQPKSDFFKMHLTISRPQKKKEAQPGGEVSFAAACAIGFYVSLDAQKRV
jgi:hypothetical protein